MTDSFLKQGAEARVFIKTVSYGDAQRKVVLKQRFTKAYRHPVLDESLNASRLRNEVRGLVRCRSIGVSVPAVLFTDAANYTLILEYIDNSVNVHQFVLNSLKVDDIISINACLFGIGAIVRRMHDADIIHGDLTPANFLSSRYDSGDSAQRNGTAENKIYVIDFGLSGISTSRESKAVDLYVFERALKSLCPQISDDCLDNFYKGYGSLGEYKETLVRLEDVRLRGRKREMIG